MNLMPSQKNFFCISLNINQSLLKLLHIGIHYRAEKKNNVNPFFYYASKLPNKNTTIVILYTG